MKPVFHKNDLKNKLDFFSEFRLQERERLLRWIFISGIVLGVTFFVLVLIHFFLSHRYSDIQNKQVILNEKVSALQVKSKRALVCKDARDTNSNLVSLLRVVAEVIPSQTWLETIIYEKNSIEMCGGSFDSEQVVNFYGKLTRSGFLNDCQFKQFFRDKRFIFRINGGISKKIDSA